MKQHTEIKPGSTPRFAPLKNVAALAVLVERLRDRHPNMPGLGVFFGFSGYGKTHAGIYAQNKHGCIKVDFRPIWSVKYLLRAILSELGETNYRGTNADLEARIVERLAEPNAPILIIDEADFLVDKNMIEIIRSIHDASNASIILIGEEALPNKLRRSERTWNRVLGFVAAQPCDLEDARSLARAWHSDLDISDAMLNHLITICRGEARRITTNLDHVADWARNNGVRRIDPSTYDGDFNDGKAPSRTGRAA